MANKEESLDIYEAPKVPGKAIKGFAGREKFIHQTVCKRCGGELVEVINGGNIGKAGYTCAACNKLEKDCTCGKEKEPYDARDLGPYVNKEAAKRVLDAFDYAQKTNHGNGPRFTKEELELLYQILNDEISAYAPKFIPAGRSALAKIKEELDGQD